MSITYQKGDATKPQRVNQGSVVIITHVCNDRGKWGKGFVIDLAKAFPESEKQYRAKADYPLGEVQFVDCGDNVIVANIIAQRGTRSVQDGSPKGCPPIRYPALRQAMLKVADKAYGIDLVEIHAPKFGAGLAGGDWDLIESMINLYWGMYTVVVYEFSKAEAKKAKGDDPLEDILG